MRLAVFGVDDEMLAVVAAAQRGAQDEIALIDATAERANEAASLAPRSNLVNDWEAALDTSVIDAVLVAADNQAVRVEQLRRLIQNGIPVLVSHPVSLSMLDCYELDMIRQETRSVVLPYLSARWHPAVRELREQMADGSSPVGNIEQIVMERFLPERNRESVLRQFARDADLLQYLAGDATKLHALGAGGTGNASRSYNNVAVQIECANGVICRWSVAPVEEYPASRVTLVGSTGKAILSIPADAQPWRLEIRPAGGLGTAKSADYSNWNSAASALERLAAARDRDDVEPTWTDAARTVELAETIDFSLARGRTIDLHREEFTDIGTFKGTMASIGCGVLILGLVLAMFVAIAGAVAVHNGWIQFGAVLDRWPLLLLGTCTLYLVLQLLLFFVSRQHQHSAKAVQEDHLRPNDSKS